VAYLLRNGADINAQNVDKDTPMHLALRANRLEVVYQLLSCGGNSRIEGKLNDNKIFEYKGLFELISKIF